MRIPRLFIDTALSLDQQLNLPEPSAHYLIHVLRLSSGDHIKLFNGLEPCEFKAQITVKGKKVDARISDKILTPIQPALETWLLQAMGKIEHIDYTVQKTTELGISKIILFNSTRTQTPLKGQRLQKKLQHWHKVAISACEQCGRQQIPDIHFADSMTQAIERSPESNRIILDFNGKNLRDYQWQEKKPSSFVMLIGPEGGFNDSEIEQASSHQFKPVLLGPRVMRMETASVALLSVLQYQFGDFSVSSD